MAYGHLFYGYYNYPDGTAVYVNIYKDGYTGDAYRIAHMQGLSLEIGGADDPIYTPVVKTTLRFSMVDAFDIGSPHYSGGEFQDCVTGTGPYDKHGRWESFYTSNPTELKVELQVNNTVIWTGFVTPDSWEESMIYRGSITVVARDMLGTLSDKPFDATGENGCISVQDLVGDAVLIASQGEMSISQSQSRFLYNKATGTSIMDALIPVAAFEGKSWWDALTETLEALGLVLRYNGGNQWVFTSLRYLPNIGNNTAHNAEFINRTGLRTLDPPVKEISGNYSVDFGEDAILPTKDTDLTTSGDVWTQVRYRRSGQYFSDYVNVPKANVNQTNDSDWRPGESSRPSLIYKVTLPADSSLAAAGFPGFADMYFIANTCVSRYSDKELYGDVNIKGGIFRPSSRLVIRQAGWLLTTNGTKMFRGTLFTNDGEIAYNPDIYVKFYVKCDTTNGDTVYYNGTSWVSGVEKTNEDSDGLNPLGLYISEENFLDIIPPESLELDTDTLRVAIVQVRVYDYIDGNNGHNGIFVPLEFSIAPSPGTAGAAEYSVKTILNEDYNVIIDRSPAIGSLDTVLPGRLFKNALKDSNGQVLPNSWNWGSGTGTGYPLEVMVQAQLLMLYASAMSIFTGDIHDKGTEFAPEPFARPGYRYLYFGRNCLLLRGTFDFVSGFISGSALREYATWEDIWGTFNPEYVIDTKGASGGEGGGQSGGGGGGGGGTGTVTSVDMTVPTGFTIGGNPITVAGTLAMGFATGYSLPLTADVNKGVTAYGWGNHAQAGYLTGITSSMVINALGFTPITGSWGSTYGGGRTADLTIGNVTRRVVLNAALSDYATKEQISDLDIIRARANRGNEAYGWGDHAQAGYALQTDLDDLAEEVAELGSPYFIITPQLTIGSRWKPLSGGGAKFGTYLFVNHPKLGVAGYEWILMRRSKRGRKKSDFSDTSFNIRRSGWSEAIGQGDNESSYNWDPLTGTTKYVDLDTLRDFIMRRFVCTYDWQLSNWRNSAYLLDILKDPRAIDPADRNYTELRFGQTFPMGSGGSHSVTREKWRTMTRTIAQFGIAIRRVNPEFLEHYNPQQTLAKTTRQISYLDGAVRKTVDRYLYSEVVPLRCFINIGELAGNNDRTWHLGFRLQDI